MLYLGKTFLDRTFDRQEGNSDVDLTFPWSNLDVRTSCDSMDGQALRIDSFDIAPFLLIWKVDLMGKLLSHVYGVRSRIHRSLEFLISNFGLHIHAATKLLPHLGLDGT